MARNVVFSGQTITGRTGAKASGIPSWASDSCVEFPDAITAWDRVYFGDLALPGIAIVRGTAKRRVDKKKSPGVNGARVTHLGWDASEFKIILRLWTTEQLAAFEEVIPRIKPKSGKAPEPVDVYHPGLALLGIRSVEILEISILDRVAVDQYETTITCIEFQKAKATKISTPKAAAGPDLSITNFPVAIQRPSAPSADPAVTGPKGGG